MRELDLIFNLKRALLMMFAIFTISNIGLAVTANAYNAYDDENVLFSETKSAIIGLLGISQPAPPDEIEERPKIGLWKRPGLTDHPDLMIRDWELLQVDSGYTETWVLVFERWGSDWFRVKLRNSKQAPWINLKDGGQFIPIETMLLNSMTYLNEKWDGKIYKNPGSLQAETMPIRNERPVDVLQSRRIGRQLWFQVRLFQGEYCELEPPVEVKRGWIPAYNSAKEIVVWFYSRGC